MPYVTEHIKHIRVCIYENAYLERRVDDFGFTRHEISPSPAVRVDGSPTAALRQPDGTLAAPSG